MWVRVRVCTRGTRVHVNMRWLPLFKATNYWEGALYMEGGTFHL